MIQASTIRPPTKLRSIFLNPEKHKTMLRVGLSKNLARNVVRLNTTRFFATPFPIKNQPPKKDTKDLSRIKRLALYFNSSEYKKKVTKYYIFGFFALCASYYYFMRDRYYEDKQIILVKKKYQEDPSSLTEYEYLMLKSLNRETLRPMEQKKYRVYQLMRKEFRRNNLLKDVFFEPTPEDLQAWFENQATHKDATLPTLVKKKDNDKVNEVSQKVAPTESEAVINDEKTPKSETPKSSSGFISGLTGLLLKKDDESPETESIKPENVDVPSKDSDPENLSESSFRLNKPERLENLPDHPSQNHINPAIVPPEDTTAFYEDKAQEYDDSIKWEERGVFMGWRRRWLMRQIKGDVLEVACGTGRNLPYFSPELINSITFLDSSKNMVNITQKKFRQSYPNFKKVAFTVGKAEDLVKLSTSMKYDTIFEAFGLCAHEDPVLALKNMATLLKPGGRIVLLEHGRSNWQFINNHLDFKSEKRMKTWACRWNLDIGQIVDEAGLDITYEKRVHLTTTWMLIIKKPQDPINSDEKPFINKLFGNEKEVIRRN